MNLLTDQLCNEKLHLWERIHHNKFKFTLDQYYSFFLNLDANNTNYGNIRCYSQFNDTEFTNITEQVNLVGTESYHFVNIHVTMLKMLNMAVIENII